MNSVIRSIYALIGLYLLSGPLRADDLMITFSGDLTMPACQIIVEEPAKLFSLGSYNKRDLSTLARTPGVPFYIDIRTCRGRKKVSIAFKGTEQPKVPGTLAIQGQASGAAVGIESEAGRPIKVNTDNFIYDIKDTEIGGTPNRLSFKAYLIPLNGAKITAGVFNTSVNVELSYP